MKLVEDKVKSRVMDISSPKEKEKMLDVFYSIKYLHYDFY